MAMLAEPVVLAAAKDHLYPTLDTDPNQYAVTDTQFTVDRWGDWPVPDHIQDRLMPFNAIHLASGNPDLLAVGRPSTRVLDGDAANNPVVAVEAKGDNTTATDTDVTRGIDQAHSRLSEVNLGYVAAPIDSIDDTARALARDCNVGVLGVHDADTVKVLEPARVTGAGTFSTAIDAIRFQASTHRLTEGSFPLNHPKNYLGYVLALVADGETESIYDEQVISRVEDGRRGALLLGLIETGPSGESLTHLGAEVVRFARAHHGSVREALNQFDAWWGKRQRFSDYAPRWAQLARSVTMQYDPTRLIVEALERLRTNGHATATIPELVREACELNQPLAIEVFITDGHREDVLSADGEVDESALDDPAVYKSGAYFQFKAQLYHVGLITSVGTDDAEAALTDVWVLEQSGGAINS